MTTTHALLTAPRRGTTAAGVLVVVGVAAGVLSVVPVLEDPDYLALLPGAEGEVLRGAVVQAVMVPAYVGFALCLYPTLRRGGEALSLGFVGFRLVAVAFHLVGVVLLPVLLEVGRAHAAASGGEALALEAVAELLRQGRDLVNHVGVIVPLAVGDALLFVLLLRRRLVPRWLAGWGLVGAGLSLAASLLMLGRAVQVVSPL